MRVRHGSLRLGVLRRPLVCAGGALRQLPFIVEQVVEIAVVPLDRIVGPRALEPAADLVAGLAAAVAARPAEALMLDRGAFGLGALVFLLGGAVGLAEGVAAGDQRHRFLVVHRHAAEGLADVAGRRHRVGIAVRPLRVDVDQAHLDGAQRIGQFAVAAIALVVEPAPLRTPVDVLVRRPDVRAAAAEAERPEAHRLQRAVPGEDQQVGPGDLAPVFLLDRPEQPARLVEVHIVGPAVEGGEALVAATAAAAPVVDAVGARGVPGHADEERAVMAVIRRPPVLRVGHHRIDVFRERVEIEAVERLGVVEVRVVGVGFGMVLAQDPQVQLVRPPMLVRGLAGGLVNGAHHRALARGTHCSSNCVPNSPALSGSVALSGAFVRFLGVRKCVCRVWVRLFMASTI